MTYQTKIVIILCLASASLFRTDTVWASLSSPAPPEALSFEDAAYCIQDTSKFPAQLSTIKALRSDANCWKPVAEFSIPDSPSKKDLFIKVRIPAIHWEDPAIYITSFSYGFEVYQSFEKIYQYTKKQVNPKTDFRYYESHIIPITNKPDSNDLIIRISNNAGFNFGDIHAIMTGSQSDLMGIMLNDKNRAFRNGIKDLLLSVLLVFIGFVSLFIFFIRWHHRDLPFLFFGLFAFCVGIKYLFTPNLLFLFNLSPLVYVYLEYISFLLVPVGLFAFVEQMFGSGKKRIIRRLWQIHLFLTASVILLISLNLMNYFFIFIVILLFNCFICIWYIVASRTHDTKSKIPFIGFFILFIILLFIELFVDYFGVSSIDTWTYDLFGWGILALVFSLGYVLVNHYTVTYQKVQRVSLELEKNRYDMLKLKQENLKSQFEALKNQINPHFLFNNFSTLISIIEEDRDMAVSFVQELSHVYRYILQTKKKALIKVFEELDFLKSYEFLLSKRFENKIILSIRIDPHHMSYFILPFSLQLLVENAIKHNVISSKNPLTIDIFDEGSYLCVRNKLQIKKISGNSTKLGLSNIINRYRFFSQREVIVSSDKSYFTVRIPLLKDKKDI